MTRVDFYQLSTDPVDVTVGKLARAAKQHGERLLVVAADDAALEHLSGRLWELGGRAFLANGRVDGAHASRQPILLSTSCDAPNDARMVILADGKWREEVTRFDSVKLLFGAEATQDARALWRELAAREDIDNRIFKQTQEGGWREGR